MPKVGLAGINIGRKKIKFIKIAANAADSEDDVSTTIYFYRRTDKKVSYFGSSDVQINTCTSKPFLFHVIHFIAIIIFIAKNGARMRALVPIVRE